MKRFAFGHVRRNPGKKHLGRLLATGVIVVPTAIGAAMVTVGHSSAPHSGGEAGTIGTSTTRLPEAPKPKSSKPKSSPRSDGAVIPDTRHRERRRQPFVNGMLTRDPTFFPISVWDQTLAVNAANYKAIGINTFLGLYHGYSTAEINAARENGLYAVGGQSPLAINSPSSSKVIPAWYEYDEPDNAQPLDGGGYGPCIPVSKLVKTYKADKAADPLNRPVMMGFGRGVSDINWIGRGSCTGDTTYYQDAAAAADIFSYDIYPVNAGEYDNLQEVAAGIDNLRGWVGPKKPVWAVVETTPYDQGNGTPTPAQTKFEVWSAIIHGARGINYFCHIFSPTFHEDGLLTLPGMKASVGRINAQITRLAPVINVGLSRRDTVTSSAGSSARVDAMTKSYRGATYIMAADMRNKATTATFRPVGATGRTVTVLGENRKLKLSHGRFRDRFAAYGVHIYKISGTAHQTP